MPDIANPAIKQIDISLHADIQAAIDEKTKPPGSLGQLEYLAKQIALIQNSLNPVADGCELIIFAADHGVASAGVSAYPAEVTRQMVLNFLNGGAAANVFSTQNSVNLTVVDAGIAGEAITHPQLISRRIGPGTKNFIAQPAMTAAEMSTALQHGITLGQGSRFRFMAFGEMGIGNTSSAAMIAHKLKGYDLEQLVGRGTGLDDAGLSQKLDLLNRASGRAPVINNASECLQEYGGFEITMMAGAMIGAASKGSALLIDGYIATAAYLAAAALRPEITGYAVFCHASAESGHRIMLQGLDAKPLLDLGLRLGEGTGALLAWPLVKNAVHMLRDMASFESSGVSNRS